jgi:two-component system cell cycle sensor histidine kinase/response regulator CckA
MLPTRVLLVGDDAPATKGLADAVRNEGYEVAGIASSGQLAMESARATLPDLVLLDLGLTGKPAGIETAAEISQGFGLPVIFLVTAADAKALERGNIAEPIGYLTKPFRMVDLVGAITIALNRRRIEQNLRARERSLSVALSSAANGVVVTDISGRIGFLNDLAKSIFSVPDVDVTGLLWSDVVRLQSKITGVPLGDLVALAILKGTPIDAGKDLIAVRSSGERREVEGEVSLCRLGSEIIGIVFTFRDVTLRNRRQEQLRQAIRIQAIAQLAGVIASPVTALLEVALKHSDEALSKIEADHQVHHSLRAIKAQVKDISRIANRLQEVSTNTASFPRVIDLNELVWQACSVLRRDLPPGTGLITDLASSVGRIRADTVELSRAIVGLASRAATGIPEGGSVRLQTRNYPFERHHRGGEVERYVTLLIGDPNPGVTQTEARRLVDPLSEFEGPQGLELDLFLIHGIIADSGGSIMMAATSDGATSYEILLPEAAASGSRASSFDRLTNPDGRSATILLLQTDGDIRNLMGTDLQQEGYEVLGAANCREALEWLETYDGPIAMLITDLVLPEMSGTQLAEQFLLRHTALRVVFMSDQPLDHALEENWSSRDATFLLRPFDARELGRIVKVVLERGGDSARL